MWSNLDRKVGGQQKSDTLGRTKLGDSETGGPRGDKEKVLVE